MQRASFLLVLAMAIGCGGAPPRPAPPPFAPETPRLSGYAGEIGSHFDAERAHATVAFVDRFFRVRGNEGYQASLARVREELAAGGFEPAQVRMMQLGDVRPTWTPRRARLALVAGEEEQELIAFAEESDVDRACLLVESDAIAPVTLEVVRAESVRTGTSARGRLVLAEGEPRPLYRELVEARGAVGLLVRNLEPYHRADEHPDAAQFGYLPARAERGDQLALGFSLSEQDWQALRGATARGVAQVRVEIAVDRGTSAATALEARIEGTDRDAGAIVFAAHVDEPGANDNASGVAALAELARALRRGIDDGALPPPRRTLVFLWGQEMEVSREWLARDSMPVGAGLVMDMVGLDPRFGAPFRIERMPDPGAVWLRAPDAHSEWGDDDVDPTTLRGHFLNDWLRAAVEAVRARESIEWSTVAHPYEGGSDHVSFLRRGLPAALAWHFTDDAYHTTRDRLDRVSGDEMRRVATVLGAAAIAMASGERSDREEMLEVVRQAAMQRMRWAEDAGRGEIAAGGERALEERIVRAWGLWYDQALESVPAWGGADEAAELAGALRTARGDVAGAARDAAAAVAGTAPSER